MIRPMWLVATGTLLLRVCGHAENQPIRIAAVPPAVAPEHAGALAVSAGLESEVTQLPDGRIVAYVRDANRAAMQPGEVDVSIRRPDGTLSPLATAYDPQMRGYVGRPTGLVSGSYPVEVTVRATPTAPTVHLVTPSMALTMSPVPAARYGGRVDVVGDQAVETVAARNGSVALFWMDLDGRPIPASDVQLAALTVTVDGTPHTVVPRVENDHFVAMVPAAPTATVSIAAPGVVVRGTRFQGVYAAATPVVAVMPPGVFVVETPALYVAQPAGPAVYVAAPVTGGIFVAGPGHEHGLGRHHGPGEWHGGGSVVVNAPGLFVGPHGHGGVFVGSDGWERGHGDDHGDDHGDNHEHGRGHGPHR